MNSYERMARIIRHLDRHYSEQPTLTQLAAVAGMSTFHFHRSFVQWIGVTPKDFLQCLTLHHAKSRLRRGDSVLASALEAGLSGSGRLHDLCVTLESASPGEIKRGGQGLVIRYGFAESPFGECLVAQTERGICHLEFLAGRTREESRRLLDENWPSAGFLRDDTQAARTLTPFFTPQGRFQKSHPLRAWVRGTPFQLLVWRALLRIPEGQVVSYGQLADFLGRPKAARAVGGAVGANPLALLIPCHRVIQTTGALGGYRWGPGRKKALLAWESSRC